MVLVEVLLEVTEGKLVPGFVFAVVLGFLLNSVVGQMNKSAADFERELLTAGPDIPLPIPPCLAVTPQDPNSDVEFPVLIQKWLQVSLYNEAFRGWGLGDRSTQTVPRGVD